MIKRLVIELEEDEHKKVKEKALKEGKTIREIFTDIIRKWLAK